MRSHRWFPICFGFQSLWLGLACGGLGLLLAGAVASRFTRKPAWFASSRQLMMGIIAIAATYLVGTLVGAAVT